MRSELNYAISHWCIIPEALLLVILLTVELGLKQSSAKQSPILIEAGESLFLMVKMASGIACWYVRTTTAMESYKMVAIHQLTG